MPPLGRENFRRERASGENFSEPSAGACAARGCAQVTADENRKARSENKSMFFTERSAAEFDSRDAGRWPAAWPDERPTGSGVSLPIFASCWPPLQLPVPPPLAHDHMELERSASPGRKADKFRASRRMQNTFAWNRI